MRELSAIARERAVLATVADVIVAAAVGKDLRVGVVCPDSQVTFVGHLARALHARGRVCRYRPTLPGAVRPPSAEPGASDVTVMVITDDLRAPSEDEVCRITIRVTADAPTATATAAAHRQGPDLPPADHDPDIVLDYHDPSGPTIRHIASQLSSPPLAPR